MKNKNLNYQWYKILEIIGVHETFDFETRLKYARIGIDYFAKNNRGLSEYTSFHRNKINLLNLVKYALYIGVLIYSYCLGYTTYYLIGIINFISFYLIIKVVFSNEINGNRLNFLDFLKKDNYFKRLYDSKIGDDSAVKKIAEDFLSRSIPKSDETLDGKPKVINIDSDVANDLFDGLKSYFNTKDYDDLHQLLTGGIINENKKLIFTGSCKQLVDVFRRLIKEEKVDSAVVKCFLIKNFQFIYKNKVTDFKENTVKANLNISKPAVSKEKRIKIKNLKD